MPFNKRGKFISAKEAERRLKVSQTKRKSLTPTNKDDETPICSGRRIVNIYHLGVEMWCLACDIPLSFRDIEEEERRGLSSVFIIRCRSCLVLKSVSTDTTSMAEGRRLCDTNTKGAIAMIDAGIGPSQMNTILSALNIPTPSQGLFKRYERIVGPALEDVAHDSCVKAIELEKSLMQLNPLNDSPDFKSEENVAHSTPVVKIAASYDMGWQKRGTGRSYDSITGHGSLIGLKSRKVLSYGTRSKLCRKCIAGQLRQDHDCRCNFSGSAKAMEPDVAVQLVGNEEFKESGIQVGVLIGDDDSSTISAVQRCSNHNVTKWSDLNHVKKGLTNMLFSLQKKHKVLNTNVIKYLKRCFSYALEQNKGNVDGTKMAIMNVIDHTFDRHNNCGTWCIFIRDPSSYKHAGLPKGKGLVGENLREDLSSIFSKFAMNASKLAPCASSQVNESFNMVVATKAPKAKFYGGSESLDFRVASAVSQKNLGTSYITSLHEKLGLSPGRNSRDQRRRLDMRRMQRSIKKATLTFKRRRLFLNSQRGQKSHKIEAREGIAYQKDMGIVSKLGSVSGSSGGDGNGAVMSDGCKWVIFDLETTGFGKEAEILQIAGECGEAKFNLFVLPRGSICKSASVINGLTVWDGKLFHHGNEVEAMNLYKALSEFITFLKDIGSGVLLVGHNILKFDVFYIIRDISALGLIERFSSIVKGFVDTLPLLKSILPRQTSYSLFALAKKLLGGDELGNMHDASCDVKILKHVLQKVRIDLNEQRINIIEIAAFIENQQKRENKNSAVATLKDLKSVVSMRTVNKMASCGIDFTLLFSTYVESGQKGIMLLLSEHVNGKPRVTTNKKIVKCISDYFKNLK